MSSIAYGGWSEVDTYANGLSMTTKSDIFGHDLSKTDLGGHSFTYSYDKAGRQISRATTGETLTTTWLNTGLVAKQSFGASDYATYTYDLTGNRLSEYTVRGGVVIQNATSTYDALGRLATWAEAGGTVAPKASKTIAYDLNGNIMSVTGVYRVIDDFGNISTTDTSYGQTFAYDAMNRVVSDNGKGITYNTAGQRMTVTTRVFIKSGTFNGNLDWYWQDSKEEYYYDNAGNLSQVKYAAWREGNAVPATAVISDLTYDAMNRVTRQTDYQGSSVYYDRLLTYNSKGQIQTEDASTRKVSLTTNDVYRDVITYNYGSGSSYALGSYVSYTTKSYKNGSDSGAPDTSMTNTYAWYDGATLSRTDYKKDVTSSTTYTSTYSLSPSGTVTSASINDGRPRTVTFKNDLDGKVVRRDEADNNSSQGDPHEVRYRYNGVETSFDGNNSAPLSTYDYDDSLPSRWGVNGTGAFTGGFTTGVSATDMDESYEGINTFRRGAPGGHYVVQSGDTLQSIAQSVWGDSSYWYKVADVNGLSADTPLVEGQSLTLPADVVRTRNNASTFKPYDASEALGNTSPTAPKPPKQNKCGAFGQFLMMAIAIAVTMIIKVPVTNLLAFGQTTVPAGMAAVDVAAATGGLTGVAGAAITGAVASTVSQGVGVATGLQNGFSWKGVATSALSAGITQGLSQGGIFGQGGLFGGVNPTTGAPIPGAIANVGDAAIRAGLNGLVGNALSQGIGVVTGIQNKFDWAGVAAEGVGAFAGAKVAYAAPDQGIGADFASSMAYDIASAATRSLVTGTDFGDNLEAALPDAFAHTVGNAVADGILSLFSASPDIAGDDADDGQRGPADEAAPQPATSAESHPSSFQLTKNGMLVAYLVQPEPDEFGPPPPFDLPGDDDPAAPPAADAANAGDIPVLDLPPFPAVPAKPLNLPESGEIVVTGRRRKPIASPGGTNFARFQTRGVYVDLSHKYGRNFAAYLVAVMEGHQTRPLPGDSGGYTNYGFSELSGLSIKQIEQLTPETAAKLALKKYGTQAMRDATGAMQPLLLEAQWHGFHLPGYRGADGLLRASGGDPAKAVQLLNEFHNTSSYGRRNPGAYNEREFKLNTYLVTIYNVDLSHVVVTNYPRPKSHR
jgi:YD repeat-containing protein